MKKIIWYYIGLVVGLEITIFATKWVIDGMLLPNWLQFVCGMITSIVFALWYVRFHPAYKGSEHDQEAKR